MNAKKQAIKIKSRFQNEVGMFDDESKKCAIICLDLMIEKMNSYSDLESHLYQNGYGTTTIVAEIICLESIKKELELL